MPRLEPSQSTPRTIAELGFVRHIHVHARLRTENGWIAVGISAARIWTEGDQARMWKKSLVATILLIVVFGGGRLLLWYYQGR